MRKTGGGVRGTPVVADEKLVPQSSTLVGRFGVLKKSEPLSMANVCEVSETVSAGSCVAGG
jgi:hypothetical protein